MKGSAQGLTRTCAKQNHFLRKFRIFIKLLTLPLKSIQKRRQTINAEVNTTSLEGEKGGWLQHKIAMNQKMISYTDSHGSIPQIQRQLCVEDASGK